MKASRFVPVAMSLFPLLGCASITSASAPFPSSFVRTSATEFEFTARGTWDYPANTQAGEQARMEWLKAYVAEQRICPTSYKIVSRTPAPLGESAKSDLNKQILRAITYIGRCDPA